MNKLDKMKWGEGKAENVTCLKRLSRREKKSQCILSEHGVSLTLFLLSNLSAPPPDSTACLDQAWEDWAHIHDY